ncbi:hypothetical protein M1116_00765 [Patescibacteria group bacterium]|nr:hypothetical protein [Patescibacteria group bacterium]
MKKWLILLFFASFLIRIYKVNSYPPPSWDEASLGYNAYSISKTLKDEYGNLLPLIFKSFGDYKPGLYVYLTVPFVYLFGLSTLSVRLPSIILGSLLPLVFYFLARHFPFKKNRQLAFIGALLLAFNPWNIHFSRGAWETNVFLFELALASLLFFKKRYLFSSIIFSLSLFTYQSAKLISLLIIISLCFTQFQLFKSKLSAFLLSFSVPLLIAALIILVGLLNHDANRLQVLSLFSYPRSQDEKQLIINETSVLDYHLFYNRFIFFTRNFLGHYLNYFSPQFLFFEGDWQNARQSAPYIGVLLYPSIIFLLVGLLSFLSFGNITLNIFFMLWLLLSPIASSLTRDTIHAVRSLPLSLSLIYFSALGITKMMSLLSHKSRIRYLGIFIIGGYLLSFVYYSDLYFNHMVKKSPTDFLYGYQQASRFVANNQSSVSHIYFSDYYGQPYIFYLFFNRYSPAQYQHQAKLLSNNYDTGKVESIDNIRFQPINFSGLKTIPHTLLIISLEEMRRQSLFSDPDFKNFIPLSPIGDSSTFYAYFTK